jgi:hypothetical protein
MFDLTAPTALYGSRPRYENGPDARRRTLELLDTVGLAGSVNAYRANCQVACDTGPHSRACLLLG